MGQLVLVRCGSTNLLANVHTMLLPWPMERHLDNPSTLHELTKRADRLDSARIYFGHS
jgi:hypothetical protein